MQIYYILKCTCKWWRKCLGTTESFKDLVEFRPCMSCHGPRKFKCPKCGKIVKAVRAEQPDSFAVSEQVITPEEIKPVVTEAPPDVTPTPVTDLPGGISSSSISSPCVEAEPVITPEMARMLGIMLAQHCKEKNADIQEKE